MYNIALNKIEFEINHFIENYDNFKEKIRKEDRDKRLRKLKFLEDDIKSEFGLTPDHYAGDIFLVCHPDTSSGLDIFQTLIFGALNRENKNDIKCRILEFVDFNEENSWHDFYINRQGSNTWHGIVGCFWSKWGEGEDLNIKRIYKLLSNHKDQIDYKQSPRMLEYYHRGALDQFFLKNKG